MRAAQARLTYLGFDPGEVDGITVAALSLFQSRNGLTVNGDLDAATAAKLEQVAGV